MYAIRSYYELFLDNPLEPAAPSTATHEIPRGLYRVGATNAPQALDLELPPQAVELSAFRIGVRPVSNAEYLAFMEAGGYAEPAHWSDTGREWLAAAGVKAPDGWRRNGRRQWFGVGINGAYELTADAPVVGISRHEAEAYAAWAATTAPELAGACLPHEYQWEAACRLGSLDGLWEVREWCANTLEPYRITSYNVCYTKLLRGCRICPGPWCSPPAVPSRAIPPSCISSHWKGCCCSSSSTWSGVGSRPVG